MSNYSEKLWPAPWLFVATALVIPASLLVFVPINFTVGVVVAIVLYLAICVALILGSPSITVSGTHFIAGRARLPLSVVGEVRAFTGPEASLERGQKLDARAWLLIRGWITSVVTIEVVDTADPTPYWLVSTRRPVELVTALKQARADATAQAD
ncbi:MAG: DUF3093 domain-containing protein [Microbacteriaceae bacterium]